MRKRYAPPTAEQIDRLLTFLPVFERPDFVPAWDRQVPEELKGSFMKMEEVWAPELEAFHQAIDEEGFAFSFAWSEWQEQAAALVNQPEALAKSLLKNSVSPLAAASDAASTPVVIRDLAGNSSVVPRVRRGFSANS